MSTAAKHGGSKSGGKGARSEVKLKTSAAKKTSGDKVLTPKKGTPKRAGSPAKRKPPPKADGSEARQGGKSEATAEPEAADERWDAVSTSSAAAHNADDTVVGTDNKEWEALSTGRDSNDGLESWVATPRGGFQRDALVASTAIDVNNDTPASMAEREKAEARQQLRDFIQRKRDKLDATQRSSGPSDLEA
uniref:Uncharacterized protein n=1 Tax=Haptolina brevifila TaxID=156173 RepID=A0A7S2IBW8_9EUKA